MSEGILGWWYTARISLITQILGILRPFFSQALLIYLLTAKKYEIDDCLTFHVEHWAIAVISSVAAMNCVQLYTLYMHRIGVFLPCSWACVPNPIPKAGFWWIGIDIQIIILKFQIYSHRISFGKKYKKSVFSR